MGVPGIVDKTSINLHQFRQRGCGCFAETSKIFRRGFRRKFLIGLYANSIEATIVAVSDIIPNFYRLKLARLSLDSRFKTCSSPKCTACLVMTRVTLQFFSLFR